MTTANRSQVLTVKGKATPHRKRVKSPRADRQTTANNKRRIQSKVAQLAKRERLTQAEIAFLWVALGGKPSLALEASAISMAESSGIVKNGNYCCHGIWAIHLEANGVSLKCAQDPICATRWAIKTQKELGWKPWTVYTGADTPGGEETYKRFLPGGKYWDPKVKTELAGLDLGDIGKAMPSPLGPALQGLDAFGGVPTPGEAVSGIGDVAGVIADIAQALFDPAFWVRVGKVLFGAVLVFMAANAFMKALFGVDLTTAIPAGRVAGAAKGAAGKAASKSVKPPTN